MEEKVIYELPEITPDQINTAYIGTPYKCMCGCAGNYAYTTANRDKSGEARGYAVSDDEVSDRKIRTRIDKMRKNQGVGIEVIDDYIFTMIINTRQYTLYLFES